MSRLLTRETWIPRPLEEVFPFFADAGNLARITPPELGFRIRTPLPIEMRAGAIIDYRISLFGLPFGWRTEITRWDPPHGFVDEQRRGPYAKWVHAHRFEARDGGTWMEDRVEYALPLEPLGRIALPLVRRQLERIFDYREKTIQEVFAPEPEVRAAAS